MTRVIDDGCVTRRRRRTHMDDKIITPRTELHQFDLLSQ